MQEPQNHCTKKPDLNLPLPFAEEELMLALWQCGGTADFYTLQCALPEKDTRSPSTLVNILYKLERKGYLSIQKKSLRNNLYQALVSKREYISVQSKRMLLRCWNGSLYDLCKELIHSCSDEELDKLFHLAEEETAGRYGGDSELYDPWMG